MNKTNIAQSLSSVHKDIAQYCARAHRQKESVHLMAVSKTQPLAMIKAAFEAGQRDFGESYLQEAISKMASFTSSEIVWHFIGPIQSNKTKAIAEHFAWAHSVDRLKIAERLNSQRPTSLSPLNICIEVNIDGEPSKSGVTLQDLPALAHAILLLPQLRLRGLMGIPAKHHSLDQQRIPFAKLREAYQALCHQGLSLDTLSMGMSGDLEAAILEGATWVRVGAAIYCSG